MVRGLGLGGAGERHSGAADPRPWGAPSAPLSSGHELATWWHQRGPLLATFAAARELLWWIGCYLVVLWTLAALAPWGRSDGVIRHLLRGRLPGTRTVVRASIGVSALGATLLSNAGPGVAAGRGSPGGAAQPAAPPVLRYAGPAARDTQGDSTPAAAPTLRYAGPAIPTAGGPAGHQPASTSRGRPDTRHRFPATTPKCERWPGTRHRFPATTRQHERGRPDTRHRFPATTRQHEQGRPDTRHRFPATTRQHERGRPDSRHRFAATIFEHEQEKSPDTGDHLSSGRPHVIAACAETLRLDSDSPFPVRGRCVGPRRWTAGRVRRRRGG